MNEQEITEDIKKRVKETLDKQLERFWLGDVSNPKEFTGFDYLFKK